MIPPPGRHGGDGPAVARALGLDPATVLDLSATLNPFAPEIAHLAAAHLDSLRHYPDPGDAHRIAADALGVDPARLALTNGGSEAIALVAGALGGRVHAEPEFALHPRNEHGPVWRSDPHNPTGALAASSDAADVWDEAFYPLATGAWSAHRPAVTVGSLTKVFACPGLRIGYLVADDAATLADRQPHWALNSLAVALVPELFERADLTRWRAAISANRRELAAILARHAIDPLPSGAPWLLAPAPGLRDALAPLGIVVRDCASFGLADHVRIAVPDDRGLERIDAALARLAGTKATTAVAQ